MCSMEKTKLQGDMMAVFKYLKDYHAMTGRIVQNCSRRQNKK